MDQVHSPWIIQYCELTYPHCFKSILIGFPDISNASARKTCTEKLSWLNKSVTYNLIEKWSLQVVIMNYDKYSLEPTNEHGLTNEIYKCQKYLSDNHRNKNHS